MTFAEKVKQHREELGWNQQQLADRVGVSKRSVAAYETDGSLPRRAVMSRLAEALRVSVDYLMSESITDPAFGMEKDGFVGEADRRYGARGRREVEALLAQNAALFAGGTLDQEGKDAFFEAVMKAYLTCKEEAKKTYGRKRSQD